MNKVLNSSLEKRKEVSDEQRDAQKGVLKKRKVETPPLPGKLPGELWLDIVEEVVKKESWVSAINFSLVCQGFRNVVAHGREREGLLKVSYEAYKTHCGERLKNMKNAIDRLFHSGISCLPAPDYNRFCKEAITLIKAYGLEHTTELLKKARITLNSNMSSSEMQRSLGRSIAECGPDAANLALLFINVGYDVNSKSIYHGTTLLHEAVRCGNKNLVDVLVRVPGIDLNIRDNQEERFTVLHYVAKRRDVAIAQVLLEVGTSTEFKEQRRDIQLNSRTEDLKSYTPLDYATIMFERTERFDPRYNKMIKLLRRFGAKKKEELKWVRKRSEQPLSLNAQPVRKWRRTEF